ncbi:Uncharacterised protein [uncultured Clostridium sp.]|uniref:Uncharacterized protein n=1 Tax=Paeniclostridium hominis TaxID=2764329 RepID=A0ABR7K100_9FIRM|nr:MULTISPECIES: hypothetical protein [Paeniclostridium]MDU1538582.1 hypothetical protein [Paeniclostridium sordellii]SCI93916.1 Uncharacterised protein [uncultured Clostridium sp.]MBC6002687.1 hypothetical protein [Paeniclostridium hominis]MBC8630471.1 hypothetical protein [[Eubacterium] tenue]SCJ05932.1 Uncharacterised protein [uncultured Clostridium sp.]
MYEVIVNSISTLILLSPPMFIKYLINNMINIVKYYICMTHLVKLQLDIQ